MKRNLLTALLPLLLSGCCTTRIVTVAPDPIHVSSYSTSVTIPKAHVVTTTRVTAADDDISLYLDLQAIGAAFAQSSNVQEFENLINNSSYMLSNLDLNRDGYVDYLRVMETVQGHAHVFVIQAVLAHNVYQDVATVVAEVPSVSTCHIQIVGDPYLYGPRFILEPVFTIRPLICSYLFRPAYTPWRSPWYWDHFPSHYRHPVPIYIGHYHAYVETFMRNHRYCTRVNYVEAYHFADYLRISAPDRRNDYGRLHPEREFVTRTSSLASTRASNPNAVVNALNIREAYEANNVTTMSTSTRSASTKATARSASTVSSSGSRSASGSSAPRTVTASGSPSASTRSASTTGTTAGRRSSETTVASSRSTTSETSTPRSATTSTGSSARSSSGATGTSVRSASTTSSAVSTPRSASTMVKSNVRSSGSSNTSIRTTTPSGKETTTSRTSSANTRSASSVNSTSSRSATATPSTSRSSNSSATPRSTSAAPSSTSRSSSGATTGRR